MSDVGVDDANFSKGRVCAVCFLYIKFGHAASDVIVFE